MVFKSQIHLLRKLLVGVPCAMQFIPSCAFPNDQCLSLHWPLPATILNLSKEKLLSPRAQSISSALRSPLNGKGCYAPSMLQYGCAVS